MKIRDGELRQGWENEDKRWVGGKLRQNMGKIINNDGDIKIQIW